MKTASILRIVGVMILAFFLLEFVVDSGDQWAVAKFPIIWLILVVLLLFAVALELMIGALQNILYRTLDSDAKLRYDTEHQPKELTQLVWLKRKYTEMVGVAPIELEQTVVLDHDYDGIRELDNNLPPWWIYLFYASIVFAVVYMVRFHIFDGTNQAQEYEIEVAEAKVAVAEFKKNNKDLVDANTVELLTDKADLAAGKAVYEANCVACHKDNGGGGIGPNLADAYWILGGGIKDVFHTVSEGGRAGKGMIAWKTELKPIEMAQVASYVLSLGGTNPADGKEPEGDLYDSGAAPATDGKATIVDSTKVDVKVVDATK